MLPLHNKPRPLRYTCIMRQGRRQNLLYISRSHHLYHSAECMSCTIPPAYPSIAPLVCSYHSHRGAQGVIDHGLSVIPLKNPNVPAQPMTREISRMKPLTIPDQRLKSRDKPCMKSSSTVSNLPSLPSVTPSRSSSQRTTSDLIRFDNSEKIVTVPNAERTACPFSPYLTLPPPFSAISRHVSLATSAQCFTGDQTLCIGPNSNPPGVLPMGVNSGAEDDLQLSPDVSPGSQHHSHAVRNHQPAVSHADLVKVQRIYIEQSHFTPFQTLCGIS